MATCGYLCPICEGKEFTEDGKPCYHCNKSKYDEIVSAESKQPENTRLKEDS